MTECKDFLRFTCVVPEFHGPGCSTAFDVSVVD